VVAVNEKWLKTRYFQAPEMSKEAFFVRFPRRAKAA